MDFLQASLNRFVGQVHYLIFVGVSSRNFRWSGAELSELWSSQDRDFISESKLCASYIMQIAVINSLVSN